MKRIIAVFTCLLVLLQPFLNYGYATLYTHPQPNVQIATVEPGNYTVRVGPYTVVKDPKLFEAMFYPIWSVQNFTPLEALFVSEDYILVSNVTGNDVSATVVFSPYKGKSLLLRVSDGNVVSLTSGPMIIHSWKPLMLSYPFSSDVRIPINPPSSNHTIIHPDGRVFSRVNTGAYFYSPAPLSLKFDDKGAFAIDYPTDVVSFPEKVDMDILTVWRRTSSGLFFEPVVLYNDKYFLNFSFAAYEVNVTDACNKSWTWLRYLLLEFYNPLDFQTAAHRYFSPCEFLANSHSISHSGQRVAFVTKGGGARAIRPSGVEDRTFVSCTLPCTVTTKEVANYSVVGDCVRQRPGYVDVEQVEIVVGNVVETYIKIADNILFLLTYDGGADRYVLQRVSVLPGAPTFMLLADNFLIVGVKVEKESRLQEGRVIFLGANGTSSLSVGRATVTSILVDDMERPKYFVYGTSDGKACVVRVVNASKGEISLVNCTDLGSPIVAPVNRKAVPSYNARLLPLITANGTLFLFDPIGNLSYIFPLANLTGRAVAVSPTGAYVFIGNTLYAFIPGDPQSGNPRVRLWGHLVTPFYGADLSRPILIKPPTDEWHAYFWNGNITITSIETGWRATQLVSDERFTKGLLGELAKTGAVTAMEVMGDFSRYTAHTSFPVPASKAVIEQLLQKELFIEAEGLPDDMTTANTVMYPITHKHPLWYDYTGSAILVSVPLDTPLHLYANVTLTANMRAMGFYYVVPPFGLEAVAGAITAFHAGFIFKVLAWDTVGLTATALTAASAVSFAVGAAIVAGGVAFLYARSHVSYQIILAAIPILEGADGVQYAAVQVFLPESVIGTDYEKIYVDFLTTIASRLVAGRDRVGVIVVKYGSTWEDYQARLKEGRIPPVDIVSLVATALGASPHAFRIVRVVIVAGQVTGAGLGLSVKTLLVAQGLRLTVSGQVAGGRKITNPVEIVSMIPSVEINGVPVRFIAKDNKAVAEFNIPGGSETLLINFKQPFFADFTLYANMCLKRDFETVAQHGFKTNFHFNWKDQRLILYKLEFVDMTMPLKAAERVFKTAAYTFSHNIEDYFEIRKEWNDSSSPTGKRYYYATRNNVLIFDPLNGGILQYCKNFTVSYYYSDPPDVAIDIILNGTGKASSLARHAVVVLSSNVPQRVRFRARAIVFAYSGMKEVVYRVAELCTGCYAPECETQIGAEGRAYVTFDIQALVKEAIQRSKETGSVAGVKIAAWITKAEQDYVTSNNNATAVYYPPLGLVEDYGAPSILYVYAYNALNSSPVVGATVKVTNGTTTLSQVTNSSGWARFNIYTGLWNVTVTKTGYHVFSTTVFIEKNVTTLNAPLVPAGYNVPINPHTDQPAYPPLNYSDVPPINYTEPTTGETTYYWWVSVQVVWSDGYPFEGAYVKMVDTVSGQTVYEGSTNGTGFVHVLVKNGTLLRVTVEAVHPENRTRYTETRTIAVTKHWWLVFRLPWTSKYYEPEVAIVSLQLLIHEGLGYFYGSVNHLVVVTLWTNTPQRVVLNVSLVDLQNKTLSSKLVEINLTSPGVFEKLVWLPLNLTGGGYARARAVIVEYESDTNKANNEAWSNIVFFRPFLDVRVRVFWEMLSQRFMYAILPNDTLKVAVGVWTNINLTSKPAKVRIAVYYLDLSAYRNRTIVREEKELVVHRGDTVTWFNYTITIPWTNIIYVNAVASHEWDVSGLNNNASVTIPVWPEAILKMCRVLGVLGSRVYEGQLVSMVCSIVTNMPEWEKLPLAISVTDNTTYTVLAAKNVVMAPKLEVELNFEAPRNQRMLHILPVPLMDHQLYVVISGHDTMLDNNVFYFKLTVFSWLAIVIIGLLLLIVLLALATVKALLDVVVEAKDRRFVTRRRREWDESAARFVHASYKGMRFVKRRGWDDEDT